MNTPKPPLVYITDDAQCIDILRKAGRLDIMGVPPGKYTTTTMFRHDGYYVMATHFDHNDADKDNGYAIVMLPDTAPQAEVAAFFQQLLVEQMGGGDPKNLTYVDFDPARN